MNYVKDVGSCDIPCYVICTYDVINRKMLRYVLPSYLAQTYSKFVSNVDPSLLTALTAMATHVVFIIIIQ